MENKTTLLFGIHMHQPVDNFKDVIVHAVNVCYKPFFEVLSRYPEFHFSVHCSGWLMQQIENDYPKLFSTILELAAKGSIEFLGGGYYEPILGVIPSKDRKAQIKKLSDEIEKKFKQKPKGLWLAERVWESSIIPDLCASGIGYTLVDDHHFESVGFNKDILDGYYVSEEGGEHIGIFPISKKLRYALPFTSVEDALKEIKSYNRDKNSAAVIFDDAEKFGMWPGTYGWVYENAWLEKFIQAVIEDENIICRHYSAYMHENKPRGIAYLPNVSYSEMSDWSLNAEDALSIEYLKEEMFKKHCDMRGAKFIKGGIWKNFFVKYEESNRIHKRMLELSQLREDISNDKFDENIYKLQTNDPLWHGVFGGLYLPNLRDNAYAYIIACENILYGNTSLIVTEKSVMDGYEKIKMIRPEYIFRFDSKTGGQLVEFDSKSSCFNWQNTLSRRKEAYHQKIVTLSHEQMKTKENHSHEGIETIHNIAHHVDEEIKDALVYDWYIKNSFIDHISDISITLENFRNCGFREYGDFANQPFSYFVDEKSIIFEREGGLYLPQKHQAHLKKTYTPELNGFKFSIDFNTDFDYFFNYVLELNLHFAEYDKVTVNYNEIYQGTKEERVKSLEIMDGYLNKKITISIDREVDILYYPLKTLSQSEQGYDFTIQGLSIAIVLPFSKNFLLEGLLEVSDV